MSSSRAKELKTIIIGCSVRVLTKYVNLKVTFYFLVTYDKTGIRLLLSHSLSGNCTPTMTECTCLQDTGTFPEHRTIHLLKHRQTGLHVLWPAERYTQTLDKGSPHSRYNNAPYDKHDVSLVVHSRVWLFRNGIKQVTFGFKFRSTSLCFGVSDQAVFRY